MTEDATVIRRRFKTLEEAKAFIKGFELAQPDKTTISKPVLKGNRWVVTIIDDGWDESG